jgi:hypothetical protein
MRILGLGLGLRIGKIRLRVRVRVRVYSCSMGFWKKIFSRRGKEIHFSYDERKYPFGIKVLIVFLTILLFLLGGSAFDDLQEAIPEIDYPRYENIPEVRKLHAFERDIYWPLRDREREIERKLGIVRGEYDTHLLEKIARESRPPLYGESDEIREDYGELTQQLEEVRQELIRADVQYEQMQKSAKEAKQPTLDVYEWKVKVRQAKVFAWEMLFWVPFLLFSFYWYTRSQRKDSLWLSISLSALIASGVLSLISTATILWSCVLRDALEWIWELIRATLFTRIIGYYGITALVIIIGGGVIVWIYRLVTDPQKWGKHRIRHGGCPHCSYPLSLSGQYCGGCGKKIIRQCSKTKRDGYVWEKTCSHCGEDV